MGERRIYVVTEVRDEIVSERLVNAGTPAQAIRHLVSGTFSAAAAKTADVARLMALGGTVAEAGDE